MKLAQLVSVLDTVHHLSPDSAECLIQGITSDSRAVRPGYLFVAIKGTTCDGRDFIAEALKRGARAIVVESSGCTHAHNVTASHPKVCVIEVPDSRKALGRLATAFYGEPSAKMKVVGITGTNGKTTVSYLIEAIVRAAGYRPAVVGTVNYRFGSRVSASTNTTPGAVELQSLLAQMHREMVTHLAMEVSSHALDQKRIEGIRFSAAIFTNLTQDHLDYHRSFEEYFQAKAKLFCGLEPDCRAFINTDDPYGRRLMGLVQAEKVSYGIAQTAEVMAVQIRGDCRCTEFIICYQGRRIPVRTRLIGTHNVYNILAAAGWALAEGITPEVVQKALDEFSEVPGRLQRIDAAEGFLVFVDYAHTDDALKNVLAALRPLCRGRLIVVFGCGGQRDVGKRPKMGLVATELADKAVLTNDNPRHEDPASILAQIQAGIRRRNFVVIPDRRQAIAHALQMAEPQDVVLIAGKGHEEYQVMGDTKVRFADIEVVKECLRLRSSLRALKAV